MTTIAPGISAKPQAAVSSAPQRKAKVIKVIEDDPTHYPDWEPVGREPTESAICDNFAPVLRRYLAERGVVGFVGSDNFIYGVKGDNKEICVSPDVYILPGVLPTAKPQTYPGSKDEGCWKTWLLGVVPNFALEVKAFKNPRKDELQSPPRHDGLGTKELIVFDPFHSRRRQQRKRFCVYRRNEAQKFVLVIETNDMRVYSEQLQAFLVAEGDCDTSLLRIGLGPNGNTLCAFESELVDIHAKRADEEAKRADDASKRADDASKRADDASKRAEDEVRLRCELAKRMDDEARARLAEATRADEEAKRADEEARLRCELAKRMDDEARARLAESTRADDEARARLAEAKRADDAVQRAATLEAELARLRAGGSKRRTKQK